MKLRNKTLQRIQILKLNFGSQPFSSALVWEYAGIGMMFKRKEQAAWFLSKLQRQGVLKSLTAKKNFKDYGFVGQVYDIETLDPSAHSFTPPKHFPCRQIQKEPEKPTIEIEVDFLPEQLKDLAIDAGQFGSAIAITMYNQSTLIKEQALIIKGQNETIVSLKKKINLFEKPIGINQARIKFKTKSIQ